MIKSLWIKRFFLVESKCYKIKEKGFTLIELMIVIAIIGILAAVAIPNFIAYRDKGYCSACEADALSIATAIADYFAIPSHTTLATDNMPLELGENGIKFYAGPPTGDGSPSGPRFSSLSGYNYATIGGGVGNIRITVVDGSGRCPADYTAASPLWSTGTVSGLSAYTKNMQ